MGKMWLLNAFDLDKQRLFKIFLISFFHLYVHCQETLKNSDLFIFCPEIDWQSIITHL